jgi:hypothetical protein
MPVEHRPQRLRVHQIELVRLVDGTLQPHGLQFRRHVDQGLDGIRHRDSEAADEGLAGKGGPTTGLDSGSARLATPGQADVDPPFPLAADTPELGRAPMAQHRVLPAGEHRRHPSAFRGERRPADRVDAAAEGAKAPAFGAVPDRLRGEPERQ